MNNELVYAFFLRKDLENQRIFLNNYESRRLVDLSKIVESNRNPGLLELASNTEFAREVSALSPDFKNFYPQKPESNTSSEGNGLFQAFLGAASIIFDYLCLKGATYLTQSSTYEEHITVFGGLLMSLLFGPVMIKSCLGERAYTRKINEYKAKISAAINENLEAHRINQEIIKSEEAEIKQIIQAL